jgi:2-iminobutanoate/2-iminopropanoate deaminase
MLKAPITTERAPGAIGPYSQAIAIGGADGGGLLFVSGQIPLDPATGQLEGGIEAQTERVIENLRAILEAGGCTFADVAKTTIFLTDLAHFTVVNAIYARAFAAPFPARSTVQVSALPRGALVEIEAIAVRAAK